MTMTSTDPFTLAHNALWAALLNLPDFANLVVAGQRVRFDQGASYPLRDDVETTTDGPELRIVQDGYELDLNFSDGSTVLIIQDYTMQITAEDHNLIDVNLVKWHATRALVKAGHFLGMPNLILHTDVTDAADDAEGSAPGHGQHSLSLLTFSVHMAIENADAVYGSYQIS